MFFWSFDEKCTNYFSETLKQQTSKLGKTKVVTKTVRLPAKRAAKTYLAAKEGKRVHDKHCPFAKNIKPKNVLKVIQKCALKQSTLNK